MLLCSATPQATIEDSGSTNTVGLRVTVGGDGQARVEARTGEVRQVKLSKAMCERFLHDLEEAGPLNLLPARHCIKSVSFGSRITIEYKGARSPDLSCPAPAGPHVTALEKDAHEILETVRRTTGIRSRNVFSVPAPHPPKS